MFCPNTARTLLKPSNNWNQKNKCWTSTNWPLSHSLLKKVAYWGSGDGLKKSTPHDYLGPHVYYFWQNCPPNMIIWDHTFIRATRVLISGGSNQKVKSMLRNIMMIVALISRGSEIATPPPSQKLNHTFCAKVTRMESSFICCTVLA